MAQHMSACTAKTAVQFCTLKRDVCTTMRLDETYTCLLQQLTVKVVRPMTKSKAAEAAAEAAAAAVASTNRRRSLDQTRLESVAC